MTRALSLVFLALLLLLSPLQAAPPADLAAEARAALAQTSGTLRLRGLTRPVTVLRDRWGIPHIYAEKQDDLFFAQGFVAAQDRKTPILCHCGLFAGVRRCNDRGWLLRCKQL